MHTHSLTRCLTLHLIAMLVSAFIAVPVEAAVPATMNYQGRLTQSNGSPVNGIVSVVFQLYNVVSGGTVLWQESQSVTVSNGYFSVELGTVTPLTPAIFANPVFLGVTVGADSQMTPRLPLSSLPYAFNSATINSSKGFMATNYSIYQPNTYCDNATSASFLTTCQTRQCGTVGCGTFFTAICSVYYTCAGACQTTPQVSPPGPQTCPTTPIGVVVTPQ